MEAANLLPGREGCQCSIDGLEKCAGKLGPKKNSALGTFATRFAPWCDTMLRRAALNLAPPIFSRRVLQQLISGTDSLLTAEQRERRLDLHLRFTTDTVDFVADMPPLTTVVTKTTAV